ncbi:hypothetical protein GCM10010218_08030 [Streptomyces mashuensis]|uniref:Uncharacterized protein n=1 Tax=Streptomyces mashuensis TaxID=33904 RepID=A0A919AY81_9ACTN|nr:hypothetical protein [Streptomyces mashuensis]GHF29270.1 hypothetical protein GCM10010218_08030 [Streptomyces mashuensis]
MPPSLRPRAAVALPAALLGAALLLPGGAAVADNHPASEKAAGAGSRPAAGAAGWVASRLTGGAHAGDDYELTADVVLGLAASGTAGDAATKATDWLATPAHAKAYVATGPRAVAKLALVAAVEHRDARKFGEQDLTTLLKQQTDTKDLTTRALVVLALQRHGGAPADAVDLLAKARCPQGGGFPGAAGRADCTPDLGTTSIAVQALLAADRKDDAKPALEWLEKQQQADGSFAANTESTALGVQALAAGGRHEAVAKGQKWLHGKQLGCDATAEDRGSVDKSLPATARALPALAGTSLAAIDGKGAQGSHAVVGCASDHGTTTTSHTTTTGGTTTGGTTTDVTPSPTPTPAPSVSPSVNPTATPSPAPTPSASATASPDPTGYPTTYPTGGTTGTTGGSESLASTGMGTALPAAVGSAALLLTGATALVLSRHRRNDS